MRRIVYRHPNPRSANRADARATSCARVRGHGDPPPHPRPVLCPPVLDRGGPVRERPEDLGVAPDGEEHHVPHATRTLASGNPARVPAMKIATIHLLHGNADV